MRLDVLRSIVVALLAAPLGWAGELTFDFNDFKDGPIAGQHEWNVYDMVKDSSPLSIVDEVGTRGVPGDKGLVLQESGLALRCVTGEPVRWLPGSTLTVKFDFRLGTTSEDPRQNRPTLTLMIGNSLLSEKASWKVGLESRPDGDWLLTGAMPDQASDRIYGEDMLIRPRSDVAFSEWFQFTLTVKKMDKPDSFEAEAVITDTKGEVISTVKFGSQTKDKVCKAIWNLPRVNVGFAVNRSQRGLSVIDNLSVSSSK